MIDNNDIQSVKSTTSLITKEKSIENLKSIEKNLEDLKKKEEIKELLAKHPSITQITTISFKEQESHPAKPLIRCNHTVRIKGLVRDVMYKQWKLCSPRIVVLIMSNVRSVQSWTNAKQIKSFQKGLMKAAENTNMWLITNGIDMGPTTFIGNAVADYISEAKYKKGSNKEKPFTKFNFFGIADEDMIKYLKTISSSDELKVDISAESLTYSEDKYRLNQNLSHYILVKDETASKDGLNLFLESLTQFLSFNQTEAITASAADDNTSIELNEIPVVSIIINGGLGCGRLVLDQIKNKFPIVVLKGSGGLADLIAYVDLEIRDRSFNKWDSEFEDTHLKPELTIRINDQFPQYRTNPMLCNNFRQNILDIVRNGRPPGGQVYISVINMFDTYTCKLENLTEVLLSALFKSQQTVAEVSSSSKIQADVEAKVDAGTIARDLNLCVDWNCPDVAKKEVLTKDPTFALNDEKKLFEEALIRKNRCEFVNLFLTQRFRLRTFLTPKRLKRMFRKIHSEDFFMTVCWESILGRTREQRQKTQFIYRELNWLVEAMTGISTFFDETELTLFVTEQFPGTEREAERKSLEIITLWAILHFRKELVRILWKHSDRPIYLALIIAMSYDHLSWYISEQSLKEELKEESKQFVSFAVLLLDKCYKESAVRSENVLNEAPKDWNYKTVVDLAAFGRFRDFFVHPSVQRWLTNKFYGNIAVKDFRRKFIRLPTLAKILLSAYLVAPIYWWIRITNLPISDIEEDVDEDEDDEQLKRRKSKSKISQTSDVSKTKTESKSVSKSVTISDAKDSKIEIPSSVTPGGTGGGSDGGGGGGGGGGASVSEGAAGAGSSSSESSPNPSPVSSPMHSSQKLSENDRKPSLLRVPESIASEVMAEKKSPDIYRPPVWTLIYEVWTAPITKFWNFQFFYTFYLSIFSVALLYPRCGNLYLDSLVSVWTALLIVDDCRQLYVLNNMNANISVSTRLAEILFKSGFLFLYMPSRLFSWTALDFLSTYQTKVLMSLALLQAFYVLLAKFLPISATLGPLLYRLKIMLFVDFLNFIRLSILVMIAFGVILQAIIYPDLHIDNELFRMAFHRAFFSLFLTPANELEVDKECENDHHTLESLSGPDALCSGSEYLNENCRQPGFWPYAFMIMYFILLKLILLTLLYALFSASSAALSSDTDAIWKYQRYGLVLDFVTRQPLPPPLNVFYYGYLVYDWVHRFRYKNLKRTQFVIVSKNRFNIFDSRSSLQSKQLDEDEYNYFKLLASESYDEFKNKRTADTLAELQWDRTEALTQENEYQRQSLRQLKGKVAEMDRNLKELDRTLKEMNTYIKSNLRTTTN